VIANIEFLNPEYFWLLVLIPFIIYYIYINKYKISNSISISNTLSFNNKKTLLTKLKPLVHFLRISSIILIIIALARPQVIDISTRIKNNQGIDIVMAIDVSASMLAKDLKPNRLEALKKVASEFIIDRKSDRIGLVEYAGESYTKTPVTSDKNIILNSLNDINYNTIIEGGTAIGMGLATSVNRLKDSRAKSKVIILLTDGVNNSGFIDPKIATELAVEFGIKTYTIGLGSNGTARAPVGILPNGSFQYAMTKVEIDEALLKEIATATGGIYFRATDNKKLEEIYAEINKLEKTEVEEFKYYNYEEKYRFLVLLALALIAIEWIGRNTVFKSFI